MCALTRVGRKTEREQLEQFREREGEDEESEIERERDVLLPALSLSINVTSTVMINNNETPSLAMPPLSHRGSSSTLHCMDSGPSTF